MAEYKEYFEKIYEFQSSEEYVLPEKVFSSCRWRILEFEDKKLELNNVKGLLSRYQLKSWSRHTSYRDPSGLVMKTLSKDIQPELLTQAWCKFYEILGRFPVVPQHTTLEKRISSLHLCEAPGAFICALNHFLVLNYPDIQWKWKANTLNPNYEGNALSQMIPDDRFIRYTARNWHFGLDCTGDITKYHNHQELVKSFADEKVDLVTADGSIDCMKDPGEQESHVAYLHYCETMTALAVLRAGGTFVLKIFTIFEDSTMNLLYLLNCLFEKVSIFKPCTSKSGNSEVYVINTNFKGFHNIASLWSELQICYLCPKQFSASSMFCLSELPKHFQKEIWTCVIFFMNKQIHTIRNNIHYYDNNNKSESKRTYIMKNTIAQLFLSMYNLRPIPNDKKIVPDVNISDNWRIHPVHSFTNYKCVPADDSLKRKILSDLIDIKIGRQIQVVQNSKFTHKENLKKLETICSTRPTGSGLYEHVLQCLGPTNHIININEFSLDVYHKFQRCFFDRVYHMLDETRHIIFINVPFHTHFLVSLLCILFQAYEKLYFGNGIIILYNPQAESVRTAKELLTLINFAYLDINNERGNNVSFAHDIVQIFPASLFDESCSSIVGLIWNYNNGIFADNRYNLQHFSQSQLYT